MTDADYTLTSPLATPGAPRHLLLALTIVWHPEAARIGEQALQAIPEQAVQLNRYAPLFRHPDGPALALGLAGMSREPLQLARDGEDNVILTLPACRMVVELNGSVVGSSIIFSREQIEGGQILTLGRTCVLCVHWMDRLPRNNQLPALAGVGSAALALREQLRMVAATDMTVLLRGETGTGKEIAARAIHALSRRRGAALVTANMAAMNEALAGAELFGAVHGAYTGMQGERKGLFAEAAQGTLFLDEIGNTAPAVQPMLLRVLEGGDYRPLGAARDARSSARLIAATDQDLDACSFNQALLRRLEAFVIDLPPLRARREDIGVLTLHLLGQHDARAPLSAPLLAEMAAYDWPGNIRQLGHALKRAQLLVQSGAMPQLEQLVRLAPVRPATLAVAAAAQRRKPSMLADADILEAMEQHAWEIKAAAGALGISRPTLYKMLDRHAQIRRPEQMTNDELAHALQRSDGELARCASLLQTPAEWLRRHLRTLGHAGF